MEVTRRHPVLTCWIVQQVGRPEGFPRETGTRPSVSDRDSRQILSLVLDSEGEAQSAVRCEIYWIPCTSIRSQIVFSLTPVVPKYFRSVTLGVT